MSNTAATATAEETTAAPAPAEEMADTIVAGTPESGVLSLANIDEVRAQTVKFAATQVEGTRRIKAEDYLSRAKGFEDCLSFTATTVVLDVNKALDKMGMMPVVVKGRILARVSGKNNPATGQPWRRSERPMGPQAFVKEDDNGTVLPQTVLLVQGYTTHNDLTVRPTYKVVVDTVPGQPQYEVNVAVWTYKEEPDPAKRIEIETERNFGSYLHEVSGSNLNGLLPSVMMAAREAGIPIANSPKAEFGTAAARRKYQEEKAEQTRLQNEKNRQRYAARNGGIANAAGAAAGTGTDTTEESPLAAEAPDIFSVING
jgi:hypothetical protein